MPQRFDLNLGFYETDLLYNIFDSKGKNLK